MLRIIILCGVIIRAVSLDYIYIIVILGFSDVFCAFFFLIFYRLVSVTLFFRSEKHFILVMPECVR